MNAYRKVNEQAELYVAFGSEGVFEWIAFIRGIVEGLVVADVLPEGYADDILDELGDLFDQCFITAGET